MTKDNAAVRQRQRQVVGRVHRLRQLLEPKHQAKIERLFQKAVLEEQLLHPREFGYVGAVSGILTRHLNRGTVVPQCGTDTPSPRRVARKPQSVMNRAAR